MAVKCAHCGERFDADVGYDPSVQKFSDEHSRPPVQVTCPKCGKQNTVRPPR